MGKTLSYGEFKFGKSPAKPTTKGYAKGGKTGLWDNIHAKRERIEGGSGERMRKPGSKGAPTTQDFKAAASKMKEGGSADTSQDKAMIKKAMKQHDTQKHSGSESTKLALKKGGNVKAGSAKREPEAMVKKEVALLKKAGAPAKIIKHEETEVEPMGALGAMKKGGKTKKYATGGRAEADKAAREQKEAFDNHYKREEAENMADRKAAEDALMYIPRKIKQGAKAVYNTVMGKKEGGDVKGYAPGGFLFSGKPPASVRSPTAAPKPSMSGALSNAMPSLKNAVGKAQSSYANNVAQTASKAASPMAGRMANAAMAAKQTFAASQKLPMSARTPMKKGGSVKKGVPTFNRTPKC